MNLLSAPLFWLTAIACGIIGWLIKSFFAHQDRIKLETKIVDLENKLNAASREHINTVGKLEKRILHLQTNNAELIEENAHVTSHNTDLRNSILEMMTPEELEDILYASDEEGNAEEQGSPGNTSDIKREEEVQGEEQKTPESSSSSSLAQEPNTSVKEAPDQSEYFQKWKKTRKKYKDVLIQNSKLKSKIVQLKKLNSKKMSNSKSTSKDVTAVGKEQRQAKNNKEKPKNKASKS